MTALLRTQRAHRRPASGRIYKTQLPVGDKWMWFLPIMGVAEQRECRYLDQAKVEIKAVYQRFQEALAPRLRDQPDLPQFR